MRLRFRTLLWCAGVRMTQSVSSGNAHPSARRLTSAEGSSQTAERSPGGVAGRAGAIGRVTNLRTSSGGSSGSAALHVQSQEDQAASEVGSASGRGMGLPIAKQVWNREAGGGGGGIGVGW
jgi:hypothetical protein